MLFFLAFINAHTSKYFKVYKFILTYIYPEITVFSVLSPVIRHYKIFYIHNAFKLKTIQFKVFRPDLFGKILNWILQGASLDPRPDPRLGYFQ